MKIQHSWTGVLFGTGALVFAGLAGLIGANALPVPISHEWIGVAGLGSAVLTYWATALQLQAKDQGQNVPPAPAPPRG